MLEEEEKIGYIIGKLLGEGTLSTLQVAGYVAWPAEGTVLLYIFMKKYYKSKKGILGFSHEELENDIISSDMEIKKLKKERAGVRERIKNLSGKEDMESKAALTTAKIELKTIEKELKDLIGRKEFDKLLLVMVDHREQLKKKGIWKKMKPPRKIIKQINKEQEKIDKADISFDEFSGYLRRKMEESINQ